MELKHTIYQDNAFTLIDAMRYNYFLPNPHVDFYSRIFVTKMTTFRVFIIPCIAISSRIINIFRMKVYLAMKAVKQVYLALLLSINLEVDKSLLIVDTYDMLKCK